LRVLSRVPLVVSGDPQGCPRPISFHFISFHFISLLPSHRARGERDAKQWWSQEQRSTGSSTSYCRWACGYDSRAPQHAANYRSGGAGRPPGEPRHEPSSQANGDAGRPPRRSSSTASTAATAPVRTGGSCDEIFYFLFLFF
jgi:hypothetical protein